MAKATVAKDKAKTPGVQSAVTSSGQRNEGEGNKTAARHYNEATTKFAKSGKVGPAAKAAKKAVDGPESKKLREAEKQGRKPARR